MKYVFDVDVASKVGLTEAVILENIFFWCKHNEANKTNYHDGLYWTYNSASAFEVQFPFLSKRQIRYALTKLEKEGYIKSGAYNKAGFDKTKWYAVTKVTHSMLQNCNMDVTKMSLPSDKNVTPIPDINTDINTDKNNIGKKQKKFIPPSVDDVESYIAEKGYNVDAQTFVDFYQSKGWVVGKSAMKDWKAAVRTWSNNRKKDKNNSYLSSNDWSALQKEHPEQFEIPMF